METSTYLMENFVGLSISVIIGMLFIFYVLSTMFFQDGEDELFYYKIIF